MPEISPFVWYLDAFRELSSCRQIGMAQGPIPFTAIVEYSRIYKVEDLEEFLYFIRLMDDQYLKLQSKKLEVKSGGAKPNKNNKNSGHSRR